MVVDGAGHYQRPRSIRRTSGFLLLIGPSPADHLHSVFSMDSNIRRTRRTPKPTPTFRTLPSDCFTSNRSLIPDRFDFRSRRWVCLYMFSLNLFLSVLFCLRGRGRGRKVCLLQPDCFLNLYPVCYYVFFNNIFLPLKTNKQTNKHVQAVISFLHTYLSVAVADS